MEILLSKHTDLNTNETMINKLFFDIDIDKVHVNKKQLRAISVFLVGSTVINCLRFQALRQS